MKRRASQSPFTSVKSEGGILPIDLLELVAARDDRVPGLANAAYHLGKHERIGEAINRSWSRLLGCWTSFSDARAKLTEGDRGTTITRERWLLPLFQELDYGRLTAAKTFEIDERSFTISHAWQSSPIHLLGCKVSLDRRMKGVAGAASASPHSLVQGFLNKSDDHLWGFLSNGLALRILRDNYSFTRQAYVEFDLEAIMDGEQYAEFALLWLCCHQSRVEHEVPEQCWLEKWFEFSREEGVRALDGLRNGVEEAIATLGAGFLRYRGNEALHRALQAGELDTQDYYRQLLRLAYRLIFLFVAEDRQALLDPAASDAAKRRYTNYYATTHLRHLAGRRRGGPHVDLWRKLRLVMSKLYDGCSELALPALGSQLWDDRTVSWLVGSDITNQDLLRAIAVLSTIIEGGVRRPVNWRNIGADELGSVYESLLELHPNLSRDAGTFELKSAAGHERKTTGSYYTPASLVSCLLDTALDPVMDEAVSKPNSERALLELKICDPACGSGHFLVAAAHRLAKRLAAVRSDDDEPSPEALRRALRDVVGRCLFGVDVNPMAIELCKFSLWLEAIEPGKPLSFLDAHLQCGNSLLGAAPALMSDGIPDDAFKPIEGDEKKVAARLKKRNKAERRGQTTLFASFASEARVEYHVLANQAKHVEESPDDDISAVREKELSWRRLQQSAKFNDKVFAADAWCAAFVWPLTDESEAFAVTHDVWLQLQRDVTRVPQQTRSEVRRLARQFGFFHWHLAFPHVFSEVEAERRDSGMGWSGGFDVVLGNPPWERIKLQEKEFFATRNEGIASAKNAAARRKLIAKLPSEDPTLWTAWCDARRIAEGASHLVRNTGRYPLCGRGDVNTYSIFAELNRGLMSSRGRVGCIVPTGIATDDTTKAFFADLMGRRQLAAFFGFENEAKLFAGIDHRVNFCLLVLSAAPSSAAKFSAFVRDPSLLRGGDRVYELSASDIARLNPNTRTCPVFRTRRDADLTLSLYDRAGILWTEASNEAGNPWGMRFGSMFHMANDSGLFRNASAVAAGSSREGPHLRLFESKMIYHFNHRFGDFALVEPGQRAHILPDVLDEHCAQARYQTTPRYWVAETAVVERMASVWRHRWFLAWRRVTDSRSSVRTFIATVLPWSAVGDSLFLAMPSTKPVKTAALLANFCSFIFDYACRQKLSGVNLNYYVVRQLPALMPSSYDGPAPWCSHSRLQDWILSRVLELTYTAWDLGSFAHDVGYRGPPFRWDPQRRAVLRAELDAAFFHLYGIAAADVDYIMDTFPIVRRREEKHLGEYRTKRQILEVYDLMVRAIETGEPFRTLLDPPPADPSVAHPAVHPLSLPAMPATTPALGVQDDFAVLIWALLRARSGRIDRIQLARAFALRSQPATLARLAPAALQEQANAWRDRVASREVANGALAQALNELADREGVSLTSAGGRALVEATAHTPPEEKIDPWYRFEARLALAVLDELPSAEVSQIDREIPAEDHGRAEAQG
ncbi:MAG: N-6 DNA methylase [Myxococcales bacterium]|nr:N-6 DNA methylase [Myxococcales bacterium]